MMVNRGGYEEIVAWFHGEDRDSKVAALGDDGGIHRGLQIITKKEVSRRRLITRIMSLDVSVN